MSKSTHRFALAAALKAADAPRRKAEDVLRDAAIAKLTPALMKRVQDNAAIVRNDFATAAAARGAAFAATPQGRRLLAARG